MSATFRGGINRASGNGIAERAMRLIAPNSCNGQPAHKAIATCN